LGNDFLPHFPSINIRQNGIDLLLYAYNQSILPNEYITNIDHSINWINLTKFINQLSLSEEFNFIENHNIKSKKQKFYMERSILLDEDTYEDKIQKINNLPMFKRRTESYINPNKPNWQERYYKSLCNHNIKQICENYLQGLEWTLKYYSIGCQNWNWKYKFNYPPLLVDLLKYIPQNSSFNYFNKTSSKA